MKFSGTIYFVALASLATALPDSQSPAVPQTERDQKLLSLFAVVTFKNLECTTTTDSLTGVCLSSTECSDEGGKSDGNCASGFGVCCLFTLTACGGTFSKNCTYISNAGFPSSITSASTTCTYNVNYAASDICVLRLDFQTFVLGAAPASGLCSDTFTATGPTNNVVGSICGTNTGQHMYVETGTSSTATTLAFVTGTSTTDSRSWRVKVSQIECSNLSRPPADCTKYYTGISGTTTSYGYPTRLQQGQSYTTCVRAESGYCQIEYSETDTGTSPDAFEIGNIATTETTTCSDGYVGINTGGDNLATGIICGDFLNTNDNAAASGTVVQKTRPFEFVTKTAVTSVAAIGIGYSLDWKQLPCN